MLHNVAYKGVLAAGLILHLAASPLILSAHEGATEMPPITIRVATRLVVIDVVVTNKKGKPITGLKAEDFTVEENGKKQKVTVFVAPGAGNPRTSAPALPQGVLSSRPETVSPTGVPTLLLLDGTNSPFVNQAYARVQMLKYAAEQAQTGVPIAVATLTDRLRVIQQFTSDPQVLITAIKNLQPQEQMLRPTPPRPESHAGASGPRGSVAFSSSLEMAMASTQQFVSLQTGYDLEVRTIVTIDALKALARILGGLPGRKNVVWLTAEFPFDLIPENRNVSDAELLASLPTVSQKGLDTIVAGSIASEQRERHAQEIRAAESQLANANVAIYPANARGLISGMEDSATSQGSVLSDTFFSDRAAANAASNQASQETMEEVAAETGGKAYVNQNELKDSIVQAVSDGNATYSLGYYPENKKWDGKFRKIKIKLSHSDTQMRYRRGYFAIETGPSKERNFEQDVTAALQINAPATQISFMAKTKNTGPGKIKVVFLVDAHTLRAVDSGNNKKMNVSLFACVFDPNGKNLTTRSVKVDRAFSSSTYQQVLERGMMVPIDLEIPPGGRELRLAVLDNQTGFIGTVSAGLEE
jgi:VWFA-related protein